MADLQKEKHTLQKCYYCEREIIQIMDIPSSLHEWISLGPDALKKVEQVPFR